jgi:hypothetical protein
VQDEPGVRDQPALNRRSLVGRGVVEDHVDLEVGRHLTIKRGEKLLELDRAVAGMQGPDHLAAGEVERGVKARSTRPLVVVRRALWGARQHR